jgi:uncharacterized protein YgiM (DUF1202 family)
VVGSKNRSLSEQLPALLGGIAALATAAVGAFALWLDHPAKTRAPSASDPTTSTARPSASDAPALRPGDDRPANDTPLVTSKEPPRDSEQVTTGPAKAIAKPASSKAEKRDDGSDDEFPKLAEAIASQQVIRLRSGPSVEYGELEMLKPGDQFHVGKKVYDWWHVRLKTGQTGWVHNNYVRLIEQPQK